MGIQQRFSYSKVLYDKGKNLDLARNYAKEADVAIIVSGYTYKDEGEYMLGRAGDRKLLTLKPHDVKLIKMISEVNDNVIVVLIGSSAIIMEEWKDLVSGIIMAWYPGLEGGNALAKLLFGEENFSGKLPFMVPKSQVQLPYFDIKAKTISYEYFHGYRLTDKKKEDPAFHFGFGLSYTTFSYRELQIMNTELNIQSELEVKVNITNSGEVAGDEIVQLYIGYPESNVERAVKELKAFSRVHLKPKESKTVYFKFPISKTAYYNVESKSWIVENGKYEVFVGPSSDDKLLLKGEYRVNP
jgi:beta-glucosidase